MWRVLSLVIGLAFALSFSARSQEPAASSSTTTPSTSVESPASIPQAVLDNLSGTSQDYRVGIGDTIEIQVVDHQDLKQTLRVSSSGEVNFPLVGPIQVAELTAAEVEARVAAILHEKKLIRQPEVLVYIRDYRAKRIYLSGEFESARDFVMSQDLTVMDAILLGGGLRPIAGRYGYIHRRDSQEGEQALSSSSSPENPEAAPPGTEVIKIDLQPLKEGLLPKPDIPLRHGDVFIVPARQVSFFFVVGEVLRPMNYPLPPDRVLLASQAIASAGGVTKNAKTAEGILVRYGADGGRTETNVDFEAILQGKQKDIEIQHNDVIFIPGSKVKTFENALLGMTDVMVMQQLFRIGRRMQMPDRHQRLESLHPPDPDNTP